MPAAAPFSPPDPVTEPIVVDLPEWQTVVARYDEAKLDDLQSIADSAFAAVAEALAKEQRTPAGAAFFKYEGDPMAGPFALEVGFPVAHALDEPERTGDIVIIPSSLPAGRAATLTHLGSYDGLGETWGRLASWVTEQQLDAQDASWEVYVTEPSPEADPATMRTDLFLALRD